jgi:signal transduction histidine kinase
VPALQAYLGMQRAQYGIAFELRADERAPRAPAELESAAFRILQEAIVNASRHSGAGRITVTAEWRDGGLALCVADDGRGFDVGDEIRRDAVGAHLGLLRLRERTDELGGRLRIESAPGRGTTVDAWLPCAERA